MRDLRKPNGQFLGWGTAISEWLPVILSQTCSGHPVIELCRVADKWCQRQAAANLRHQASILEERCHGMSMDAITESARPWMARAQIFRDAAERLRQI